MVSVSTQTLSRTRKMEPACLRTHNVFKDHTRSPNRSLCFWLSDYTKAQLPKWLLIYYSIRKPGKNNYRCGRGYIPVWWQIGFFAFPSTSANVHKRGILKEKGWSIARCMNIYDNFLRTAFGYRPRVAERMRYFMNITRLILYRSRLLKFDIKTGDTEGLVTTREYWRH